MQENTARKRASLLQKTSKWGDSASSQPKPSKKQQRQHRLSRPGYDTSTDPIYPNVDIIHAHVPVMEEENAMSTTRKRSGSLPNETARPSTQLSHSTTTRSQEEDYRHRSSSDFELEDYLEQDDDDEEAGLTHEERKQKRKWIWRNMRPDGRVAGASAPGKHHDTMWSPEMIKANSINALFIVMWYTFSIGISVYNTWMFSKGGLHFPFPLFTTCAHMVVQFVLSGAVLFFLPRFRPKPSASVSNAHGYTHLDSSDDMPEKEQKPQIMTRWFYLTRIGPCGAATAMDIGLGNFSLRYISLTFYTMCKSSVLAFVLLFAFLFNLEKPSWKLGAIIAIMTLGVIMMVAGEADFQLTGFVLIMSAALCSGFRWSLTQILLLRNPATSNPFSSIFFLTPVMFLCLLVLAVPIEGPLELVAGFQELAADKGYLQGVAIMMAPGILAFMMVASEFALLQRTSVVTLSVCGIFKEVLTISTAARTFGDELSTVNISGLFVTILAIAAYNYLKYQKMKEDFEKRSKGIAMKEMATERGNDNQPFESYRASRDLAEQSSSNLLPVDGSAGRSSRMNGDTTRAVHRSDDTSKAQ